MARSKRASIHYVNNADFSQAVVDYVKEVEEAKKNKEQLPIVPDYIAHCFLRIAEGLSHKSNFIRYTYREEMVMDAVEAMIEMNIGSIIVLNENGQFCGIVTERDVLERVIGDCRNPQETQVNEIMTSPVIAVESNISLREALKLMRDHNVRRLAVTREGELEGQVTERRVLDALIFISKLD